MSTKHVVHLGKLIGNLQSLESLLRVCVLAIAQKSGAPTGPSYWSLNVGDEVAADEFTNYDPLGPLISKYNQNVDALDSSLKVDGAVVDLRDLLAHGRVSADTKDLANMKIIKFDKPASGKVRVVASILMDDPWFESNIELVRNQILRVHSAYEKIV